MSALFLHVLAGLVAGSGFRAQTLVTFIALVLVEAVACGALRGMAAGAAWLLANETALQAGYLGGIYLRSVLERRGSPVSAQPGRPL